MNNDKPQKWALYGGAGFIGQHLANSILSRSASDSVTLLDLLSPQEQGWRAPLQPFLENGRLSAVKADVRDYRQLQVASDAFDVMVNLAAIHREPGHEKEEYFETNVSGARNICQLAEEVGCGEIIFTSSISVYGIHDRPADENSTPVPKMPYGQSKLEAEDIHRDWANRVGGKLSIIRPGVVFGRGEEGNVSRLVSEMLKRDRAIRIHPDQVKAGIYIEELLSIIHWLRTQDPGPPGFHLVNGVTETPITFNAYGRALDLVKNLRKQPFTAPEVLLKTAAATLTPLSRFFPAGSKVHPRRITKLTLVNDIRATALMDMGYPFSWSLESALEHWLQEGL
jgi:nucleoside-diphosphate-sugar epimerase